MHTQKFETDALPPLYHSLTETHSNAIYLTNPLIKVRSIPHQTLESGSVFLFRIMIVLNVTFYILLV